MVLYSSTDSYSRTNTLRLLFLQENHSSIKEDISRVTAQINTPSQTTNREAPLQLHATTFKYSHTYQICDIAIQSHFNRAFPIDKYTAHRQELNCTQLNNYSKTLKCATDYVIVGGGKWGDCPVHLTTATCTTTTTTTGMAMHTCTLVPGSMAVIIPYQSIYIVNKITLLCSRESPY